MNINYVHPINKSKSKLVDGKTIYYLESDERVESVSGCYDFASHFSMSSDSEHYEKVYSVNFINNLNEKYLYELWETNTAYQKMLSLLENLKGKRILLLGNGVSLKELVFLFKGAEIVYTDLSLNAVKFMKNLVDSNDVFIKYRENIIFDSVDALRLPYENETFDIVYGCAFAHHINPLEPLLRVVNKVLKPGGRFIFLDDAYSKWWQLSKSTLLKPLQLYSHWKTGISPEDIVATRRGGYKYDELLELTNKNNFKNFIFIRTNFFEYLIRRFFTKIFHQNLESTANTIGKFLDNFLSKKFISKRGMVVIWSGIKCR